MKKVNDEFAALIMPLLKSDWNSIQETLRIAQNKELSNRILRGMAQIRAGH
ncbi:type II toxin-antitoxin system Phd/YefM family antitoxin [Streptococcus sp. 202]|uniref:type II toxin-antitoxin system Phd/YefM family antitoxin n=1 Tax=Streptococcus sp. 202 TaxID=2582646 RepID=UPI00156751FC|nr:type II toxin-antitoxin system Phd/YefM family antitoxin [Streptococcus sp. 202]